MSAYIVRRIFWMLVTVLGVCTITFFVAYVTPADPARVIAGAHASAATLQDIDRMYGFNLPLDQQFVRFLGNLVHFNLGNSYEFHAPAMTLVLQRLPHTLYLGVFAVAAELIIGIPIGIYSALRRDTFLDTILTSSLIAGVSLPTFWFGVILIYVFAFKLPIFPLGGFGGFGLAGLPNVVLPALTWGITGAAYYARVLRANLLETLQQDYVRTARAKGVSSRRVFHHAFRNALIPFVTQLGMDLAATFSGLVILESVFAWPGVGQLVVQSIAYIDVPVIMSVTLFTAVFVVLFNFLVDILYLWLDPRITYA